MKKKLFRILSVFVLLSIIAGSIPAQTTAVEDVPLTADTEISTETTPQMNTEIAQPLSIESSEETQAFIVQEDITMRDEFVKHFQMSDGSYTAAVYNEPIHQLVDGAWVEVDNSLTLSTSAKVGTRYKTVNGLTDVSFAQSFRNELVTMEQDNHSITWGVQAVVDPAKTAAISSAQLSGDLSEPAQAQILSGDLSEISAQEQKVFATKSASVVRYSDALTNDVDLEYTVLPSRVKESIILGSPQSISAYTVTVNTSDLSARLLDNREVEFYTEDGEAVFTMWAPYMYDSASELSEDIGVELTPLGNGQYAITLTPDAGWLNSPDRVYPVVIDPDVAPSRARTNIIDNTVMEGAGNQNSNLDRLYIGKKSGSTVRAYMKYSVMPAIPSDATITAATQTVYITSGTSTANTALACVVTGGDWSSDTITWANRPTAATQIHPSIDHNNCSYYTFSCLSAVQGWYSGSSIGKNRNYGIVLRYTNETINDYNSFYSADYSVESRRPQLTISYQIATEYITINEGDTYKLTPPDIPGTISWESGKTSVVTVDNQGNITGVKAGSATVYASSGGEIQKLFIVRITIPDGVYYLKNHTGFYLTTSGSFAENTTAFIDTKQTSNVSKFRQLWKITHLSGDYYSIRPMHKLNMALHTSGNVVNINTIGTGDSLAAIPSVNRWQILSASYGYTLCTDGSSSKAMRPAENISPGTTVITDDFQANAKFYWSLEPVSGVFLYNTSNHIPYTSAPTITVDRNSYYSLNSLGLKFIVSGAPYNDQTVTLAASSSSVGTISATGAYSPTGRGRNTIIASKTINGQDYRAVFNILCKETIYVKNYYDQTFASNSTLIGLIDDAVAFLNKAFEDDFYLTFVMDGSPARYPNSALDICSRAYGAACNTSQCGTTCSSHHKNVHRIADEAYNAYFSRNHVVILWSDSPVGVFCSDHDGHTPLSYAALVIRENKYGEWKPQPVVQVLNVTNYSNHNITYDKAYVSAVLAHEIAHTLNLGEVYADQYGDCANHASGEGMQCVMEPVQPRYVTDFIDQVNSNKTSAFCNYCINKLRQYIPDNAYES